MWNLKYDNMDLSTKQKHTQRADSRWQESGGEELGGSLRPAEANCSIQNGMTRFYYTAQGAALDIL